MLDLECTIAEQSDFSATDWQPPVQHPASLARDAVIFGAAQHWIVDTAPTLPGNQLSATSVAGETSHFTKRADSVLQNVASPLDPLTPAELVDELPVLIAGGHVPNSGLRLFVGLLCSRVINGYVHPYVAMRCLNWAGSHKDADPTRLIAKSGLLCDLWTATSAAFDRSAVEQLIRNYAISIDDGFSLPWPGP